MDSIFSLAGLILACIFGIPSLIVILRSRRSKIQFITKGTIEINNQLLVDLPDLDMTYKGKPLTEDIFKYSGSFVYLGNRDVVDSDIKTRPSLIVPEGYYWIEAKITSCSENLKSNIYIKENTLEVDFDLLKNGDFISVEAFYKSDDVSINKTAVQASHRIANIPPLQMLNMWDLRMGASHWFTSVLALFFLAIIITVTYYPKLGMAVDYNYYLNDIADDTVRVYKGSEFDNHILDWARVVERHDVISNYFATRDSANQQIIKEEGFFVLLFRKSGPYDYPYTDSKVSIKIVQEDPILLIFVLIMFLLSIIAFIYASRTSVATIIDRRKKNRILEVIENHSLFED